jgi:hypothetical protein
VVYIPANEGAKVTKKGIMKKLNHFGDKTVSFAYSI